MIDNLVILFYLKNTWPNVRGLIDEQIDNIDLIETCT